MIVFADDPDFTPEERRDRLTGLPPSAKLVYKTLEYEGSMTQSGLAEATRLPNRTVRSALSDLMDADLVSERVFIPDARQRVYLPKPVATSTDGP